VPEGIALVLVVALVVIVIGAGAFAARGRSQRSTGASRGAAGGGTAVEAPRTTGPDVARPPTRAPHKPAPGAPQVASRPTLRNRLTKSRRFLSDRLAEALGNTATDETWEDVEAALIQADIGVTTATKIVDELRTSALDRRAKEPDEVMSLLAQQLVALFDHGADRGLVFASEGPTVWVVVGVNGTGKTTTIGKLAGDLSANGRTVALAAADTFRAAADEQLGAWAERAGAQLVKHQPGADPGAVAFDAYKLARARAVDVLIIDTAGRLHTKTPLMDELAKVRRVIEKEGDVHESLLVIDATAGQNGLVQARAFARASGVTGVVLTKLDGSAKGGIALTIEDALGIPIKLIGLGEGMGDLEPFDPKAFVDALLA
jgi:fused signal recognition particle receptor